MTAKISNADEVIVIRHLIGRLENLLADRQGDRHEPLWEPRQNVVLGVLESRFAPPPLDESGVRVGEDPSRTASLATAGETAIPSLGIDFKVRSPEPHVAVEVDLTFAIYLQEYATLDEQRQFSFPEGSAPMVPDPTGRAGRDAQSQPSPPAASSPIGHTPPATRPKPPLRTRPVNVVGVWRRRNVNVPGVRLQVPLTEAVVESSNDLNTSLRTVIDAHFALPEAARPFSGRRQIRESDLVDEATYRSGLRRGEVQGFTPKYPTLRLSAFAQALPDGQHLVSVFLANATVLPEDAAPQDLAAYDCRLALRVLPPSSLVPQVFALAPRDYRFSDLAEVSGRGIACVARLEGTTLHTDTLPCFVQRAVEPRQDHIPALRWEDLANDPTGILSSVEGAMVAYLAEWQDFLAKAPPDVAEVSAREMAHFAEELRRFRLGRRSMEKDPRLAKAFRLANRAMREVNATKGYDSWRLFQLVYVVTHLPSLAAREFPDDGEMVDELTFADVLWFPTGGGKTEAYLGLIAAALFYDRMRGKGRGTTAWLKFPLRMLSVQQLDRVLRLLVVAEGIRLENTDMPGDPFLLGYLVGGANTPNALRWEQAWWPGFEKAQFLEEGALDEHRLVAQCPYCREKSVGLSVDGGIRILHRCRKCGLTLPIAMSDEEVYRYAPAILVGTVDKLTGFAFFVEFTQLAHGPRWRCPAHGYFSFYTSKKCLVGDRCNVPASMYETVTGWKDPVPAFILQDEMHLLREELGAFDAHYEGLLAELQRAGASALPSKILSASATIEQYEDQLRQVYGRRPRSFPSAGFTRLKSFYAIETPDIRRMFVGVLPHYRRKADVAALVQAELLSAVAALEDEHGREPLLPGLTAGRSEVDSLLLNYELSLAYVNSKAHGDQIAEELGRLSDKFLSHSADRVDFKVLTGQLDIGGLAEAIARAEEETLLTPRADRLRALVGTSVVSHGVDLSRLNILVMAGLPPTIADYIQATSRAGRAHAGLVVTICDTFSRRERSTFVNFMSAHRFLDRMVEPVPVNKYAYFGADRTLPGIVMALLWDMARDPAMRGPLHGIRKTRDLHPWWTAESDHLKTLLRARIERCYRSHFPGVNEAALEDELVARVIDRWERHELGSLQAFDKDRTVELFKSKVLTSFRDVDEAVDFEAKGQTADAIDALSRPRSPVPATPPHTPSPKGEEVRDGDAT